MYPPPLPRIRGLEKNRLEALIDGVFAVALTLLVLDLKLPDDLAPATNSELWKYLLGLERHFVIYTISFIVIECTGSTITSSSISSFTPIEP